MYETERAAKQQQERAENERRGRGIRANALHPLPCVFPQRLHFRNGKDSHCPAKRKQRDLFRLQQIDVEFAILLNGETPEHAAQIQCEGNGRQRNTIMNKIVKPRCTQQQNRCPKKHDAEPRQMLA